MRYEPKPGDRVTCGMLVGEWEVTMQADADKWWVQRVDARAAIPRWALTPVAPPLPPEPAVGSVVRAHGCYWTHDSHLHVIPDPWVNAWGHRRSWTQLAGEANGPDGETNGLSPVVAVDDVEKWLKTDQSRDQFRANFGWDK